MEPTAVTYEDVTVQATAQAEVLGSRLSLEATLVPMHGLWNSGWSASRSQTGAAIDAKAQIVAVLDVEPGSGTVEVRGPAVVTVGLTAYEITIIYTADAQISADKVIAVQIPEGWSDPIDDDASNG